MFLSSRFFFFLCSFPAVDVDELLLSKCQATRQTLNYTPTPQMNCSLDKPLGSPPLLLFATSHRPMSVFGRAGSTLIFRLTLVAHN